MNDSLALGARAGHAADAAATEARAMLADHTSGLDDDFEKAVVTFAVAGVVTGAAMALLAHIVPPDEMRAEMDAFIARCFRFPGDPATHPNETQTDAQA